MEDKRTNVVTTLVEKEIWDEINIARGHEPRSSFVRRILVEWYNRQPGPEKGMIQ